MNNFVKLIIIKWTRLNYHIPPEILTLGINYSTIGQEKTIRGMKTKILMKQTSLTKYNFSINFKKLGVTWNFRLICLKINLVVIFVI